MSCVSSSQPGLKCASVSPGARQPVRIFSVYDFACFSSGFSTRNSRQKTGSRYWNLPRGARTKLLHSYLSRTGNSENDKRKLAANTCSGPNAAHEIGSFALHDSFAHFRPTITSDPTN